jgi:hypothetical protein
VGFEQITKKPRQATELAIWIFSWRDFMAGGSLGQLRP